jgi:hypothetical protein
VVLQLVEQVVHLPLVEMLLQQIEVQAVEVAHNLLALKVAMVVLV